MSKTFKNCIYWNRVCVYDKIMTLNNLTNQCLMKKENKNADCTYTKFWRELSGSNSNV